MTTIEELKKAASGMLDTAWQLRQTTDQLVPVWLIIGPGGGQIVGSPWRDNDEKVAAVVAVAVLAREARAMIVVGITDAWVSTADSREALTDTLPSKDPMACEALVATAYAAAGNHLVMMR